MEKNTVILDVATYNELRDFKEKTIKEHGCIICNSSYSGSYAYISTDEAVKKISETNVRLKSELNLKCDQIQILSIELAELKRNTKDCVGSVKISLDDVKNMSFWQWRKWRNS